MALLTWAKELDRPGHIAPHLICWLNIWTNMNSLVDSVILIEAIFAKLLHAWTVGDQEFVVYFEADTALMTGEVLLVLYVVFRTDHMPYQRFIIRLRKVN